MRRSVHDIVEEQIHRWHAERNAVEERARVHGLPALPERPLVVAMATAVGSRGGAVARGVGDALGVPVHDREVVQHIAETAHVHLRTVETLDQRARNRLDDYLLALFRERNFDQNEYLRTLTRTVVALWEHGPCVLVDHGAVYIVDRRRALLVRIVAHEDDRVRHVMDRNGLAPDEARSRVRQIDAERAGFHRRFFRTGLDDPVHFDLVVNVSELGVAGSAALVVDAFRSKFPQTAPAARSARAA